MLLYVFQRRAIFTLRKFSRIPNCADLRTPCTGFFYKVGKIPGMELQTDLLLLGMTHGPSRIIPDRNDLHTTIYT